METFNNKIDRSLAEMMSKVYEVKEKADRYDDQWS